MYSPRTKGPKSERLYSERSSSAATVLTFFTEFPFCLRHRANADDLEIVERMIRTIARYRKRIEAHARGLTGRDFVLPPVRHSFFDRSIRTAPIPLASLQYSCRADG